jgi:hypothetical protein
MPSKAEMRSLLTDNASRSQNVVIALFEDALIVFQMPVAATLTDLALRLAHFGPGRMISVKVRLAETPRRAVSTG